MDLKEKLRAEVASIGFAKEQVERINGLIDDMPTERVESLLQDIEHAKVATAAALAMFKSR